MCLKTQKGKYKCIEGFATECKNLQYFFLDNGHNIKLEETLN